MHRIPKGLDLFVVPFAIAGPILIVTLVPWTSGIARFGGLLGALATGVAIAVVWRRQFELADRLDALERDEQTVARTA